MDTLVHADIFFFVTTIAVIVVGAALTVALIYLAKVLSDIRKITGEVREETGLFRKDLGDLRNEVRRSGFRVQQFLDLFRKAARRRKTTRSKKS